MSFLKRIIKSLADPRLKGIDVDSDELVKVHRKIMLEKPLMNKVFKEFYDECRNFDDKYFKGEGARIELGAGVSFFKEVYPDIVSTDIKKAENLDRVLDAQKMDLKDNSVRAFYGLNCFHHFPEPRKFFDELDRTLVNGGGCVLIEPYFGPIAAKMYTNLFDTEIFDKSQKEWESDSGYMQGANQALSYIVFIRDRGIFEKEFPNLEIVETKVMNNYLKYLVSGGLNFRALLPNFMSPVISLFELLLRPFNKILGLHYAVVIRKRLKFKV
jgi:SAM-dependent methyltransferase